MRKVLTMGQKSYRGVQPPLWLTATPIPVSGGTPLAKLPGPSHERVFGSLARRVHSSKIEPWAGRSLI
jgi:hypothetical protein